MTRRLNLGCNKIHIEGWINIDSDPADNPDVVRDLERGLPFDDDSVDEVLASHVLEHIVNLRFVLQEVYRVCKDGAVFTIVVPLMDASDMTHIRFFDRNTFRTLIDKHYWENPYYFCGCFEEISRSFNQLSTAEEMTLVLKALK